MTVALPATEAFRRACPAAVHVDGTARPQVVSAAEEPELHRLLTAYHARTGRPALVNTSFNMHQEPIVASPARRRPVVPRERAADDAPRTARARAGRARSDRGASA